jgi:hypothetical protein
MPYKDPAKRTEYFKKIASTDSRRASKKRYRDKHKAENAARSRNWYRTNKEKQKWYKIKKAYGLTQEEYLNLWRSQLGICPICGRPLDFSTAVVDHDHENNVVRGLLHRECNLMLGHFEPFKDKIHNIIKYIGDCK